MFSHIVVLWLKADTLPSSIDTVIEKASTYLPSVPGVKYFHAGRMVGSERPVVDQSYQVALNMQFEDKATHDRYQVHPLHQKFLAEAVKPYVQKVLVYDFE